MNSALQQTASTTVRRPLPMATAATDADGEMTAAGRAAAGAAPGATTLAAYGDRFGTFCS
jgi:hypothetical protein